MVVTIPTSYVTTLGPDVIDWIEANCVYPADRWLGQPFVLLPWQRRFINRLYACDNDATLAYRWALLGVPKKNGKTALAAALSLYHLFGDPDVDDPWAVCAASSDNQADLVFGSAKRIVELSPTLSRLATVFKSTITPRRGPGKLERVAAAKGKNDGKNISFLLLDELHEWNEQNWTVLTNGTVGRRRAQIIQITTAGFDLDSVCGTEYTKGRAIAAGEIANPSYYFEWHDAPQGSDYREPETWRAANPSFGTLVTEASLQDKLLNTPESQFRRYFLNQWVESETLWLPSGVFESGLTSEPLVQRAPTWVGWDASTRRDSTAVVAAQWVDVADDDEITLTPDGSPLSVTRALRVKARIWERPRDMNNNFVEGWQLPIAEVEAYVRDLRRDYDVREVAYDPAFITWSAATLEAEGIPMVEFPQTDSRMVPATGVTFELAVNGRLQHVEDDEAPLFEKHVRQTAVANSRGGGQRVAKGKTRAPMDGSVALVMAAYRAVKSLLEDSSGGPLLWIPGEGA